MMTNASRPTVSKSRKESIPLSSISSGELYDQAIFIFCYSFDVLEEFCNTFHWNILNKYSKNVTWRLIPHQGRMQLVWNQERKLLIIYRVTTYPELTSQIRVQQECPDDAKMYFIELPGAELTKAVRDELYKCNCRTSPVEIVYNRLLLDYQECMNLLNDADYVGSLIGSMKRGSIVSYASTKRDSLVTQTRGSIVSATVNGGGSKRQSLITEEKPEVGEDEPRPSTAEMMAMIKAPTEKQKKGAKMWAENVDEDSPEKETTVT